MKVGDLVRCPSDDVFWWGGKVAVVIGLDDLDDHQGTKWTTARVLVAAHNPGFDYVAFGTRYLEVINEAR